jgi:hypothetical protein
LITINHYSPRHDFVTVTVYSTNTSQQVGHDRHQITDYQGGQHVRQPPAATTEWSGEDIMAEKPTGGYTHYHAYLFRLWQETEQSPWRFSLQTATTDEQHCFADLKDLLNFLTELIEDEQVTHD